MRDTTTHGLIFTRPLPQGSAPPASGAFWTDEYGWLVPVNEWCLIHKIVPIKNRGFCEQYDLDADGLEDCEVVRLRAPSPGAGIGGDDAE